MYVYMYTYMYMYMYVCSSRILLSINCCPSASRLGKQSHFTIKASQQFQLHRSFMENCHNVPSLYICPLGYQECLVNRLPLCCPYTQLSIHSERAALCTGFTRSLVYSSLLAFLSFPWKKRGCKRKSFYLSACECVESF